ncbi:two-component system sensor histidine kinase NtrB [Paenibacillus sp. B-A-8]|uniref:two-component system sensor histidine kinase NtrB n=1 Tax=Paenibacillus sp. B-A-8 TaxID=3400419 RepID=UPI003B024725
MIVIIGAIKDIFLQISAACSFLFLIQWWVDQGLVARKKGSFPDNQTFLVMACTLSLILCTLLSTTLFGIAYLNLGMIPAYIGILYGTVRSGILLSIFLLVCNIFIAEPTGISNMILNSGILLYPLLFGLAKPFKKGTVVEKIGMLWMVLCPNMLFIALVPIIGGKNIYESNSSESLLITLYLFFTIALGGIFVYFVEMVWSRWRAKVHMETKSDNFQWESEKLQQITNVVPISIMSLDDYGVVTELNDCMLGMIRTHYPHLRREDIINKPVRAFFNGSVDAEAYKRVGDNIREKRRSHERMIHESRVYQIYSAPLVNTNTALSGGVVLIAQDITDEVKLRSELDHVERLSLVGQMAAGITHEIRNPMAVVRGFLQLMREKSSDDLDSYYQIVLEELDRANSIINDFLSLAQSRISDKEKVLLHRIIEEISPLLWADANLRGQSVELKLNASIHEMELNVREIKQLILNLGRNGMEAMGPKGILTLETHSTQDKVELIVRDRGIGMSESQREKLFSPFFTTKREGTGLGLSLCLSIVERHNGKINVESVEGEGTVFTISFPLVKEEYSGVTLTD